MKDPKNTPSGKQPDDKEKTSPTMQGQLGDRLDGLQKLQDDWEQSDEADALYSLLTEEQKQTLEELEGKTAKQNTDADEFYRLKKK